MADNENVRVTIVLDKKTHEEVKNRAQESERNFSAQVRYDLKSMYAGDEQHQTAKE